MTDVCQSHQNMPHSSTTCASLESRCSEQTASSNANDAVNSEHQWRHKQAERRHKRRGSVLEYQSSRAAKQSRRDYRSYSGSSGGADKLSFLLGGNQKDPLNLGAIGHDNTPATSPPQLNVEIVVPKNPRDPLNLTGKSHRKRKRKESWRTEEQQRADCEPATGTSALSIQSRQGRHSRDKIVSPVILPQLNHGHHHVRPHPHHRYRKKSGSPPKKIEKQAKTSENSQARFRYGNYNRYYGKRITEREEDPRLAYIDREWIETKDVLDIGCNVGVVSLKLARDLGPKRVLGIDIDPQLIRLARHNARLLTDKLQPDHSKYPVSFAQRFGPLSAPALPCRWDQFPQNVSFRHENYVLDSDQLLNKIEAEFDTILALSITKWVHLNWGDVGLKRFFHRVFRHLRPGGIFVLEPQEFSTYQKKSRLTADMKTNYRNIQLKPDAFSDFLVDQVGFVKKTVIKVSNVIAKGFKRPILVFMKPTDVTEKPCSTKRKKFDDGDFDETLND